MRARKNKTTLIEIILFGLLGVMLLAGGMAVYSQISPSYEKTPSTVPDGFRRDRINILVIGIGGDTHPGKGKELADALMLVSLKPSTKQAALISIPRDYYIRSSRYGAHRINAAHEIGNNSGYPGRGPALVSDEVRQITGQPVDAFVRIDFKAFEKLIDSLGGVDIYVYRPFHDRLFNETFHGGWQRMNGKRALAFARYRHVQGAEGTAYARELRQQQIASAVRDKLRNLETGEILRLLSDLMSISRHTTTNLTSGEIVQLYRAFRDMEAAKVRHVSLAPLTEVYTVQKFSDDGWAVRPLDPSGNAIRQMMKTVFNGTTPIATPDQIQIVEGVAPQPATIAGDDTMMDPTAVVDSRSRSVGKPSSQGVK
ncbi:MAG TPA: LCP family protein [Vicinamibacterales bacterium]|nr:LCP family protein [Vicinamibacterales bacterium]